jgi:hypothetical protein
LYDGDVIRASTRPISGLLLVAFDELVENQVAVGFPPDLLGNPTTMVAPMPAGLVENAMLDQARGGLLGATPYGA